MIWFPENVTQFSKMWPSFLKKVWEPMSFSFFGNQCPFFRKPVTFNAFWCLFSHLSLLSCTLTTLSCNLIYCQLVYSRNSRCHYGNKVSTGHKLLVTVQPESKTQNRWQICRRWQRDSKPSRTNLYFCYPGNFCDRF